MEYKKETSVSVSTEVVEDEFDEEADNFSFNDNPPKKKEDSTIKRRNTPMVCLFTQKKKKSFGKNPTSPNKDSLMCIGESEEEGEEDREGEGHLGVQRGKDEIVLLLTVDFGEEGGNPQATSATHARHGHFHEDLHGGGGFLGKKVSIEERQCIV